MSHPFDKYRYPDTNHEVLTEILRSLGFILRWDDDEQLYFEHRTNSEHRVTIPREEIITGLTIHELVAQIGIEENRFRIILEYEIGRQQNRQ